MDATIRLAMRHPLRPRPERAVSFVSMLAERLDPPVVLPEVVVTLDAVPQATQPLVPRS